MGATRGQFVLNEVLRRAPLLLVVAIVMSAAVSTANRLSDRSSDLTAPPPTPVPSLPGTPGHFDNGEFAFDYPTDWRVLRSPDPFDVVAVLGIGSWRQDCRTETTSLLMSTVCGPYIFDVSDGGIVVIVSRRAGAPGPWCQSPEPTANASAGGNLVLETVDGRMTRWEVARPGKPFSWPENLPFEAHTSSALQLARATAMVASVRWGSAPGVSGLRCP
jgi:hypothetical protein